LKKPDQDAPPNDDDASWVLVTSSIVPSTKPEASRTLNTHPVRTNAFTNHTPTDINTFIRSNEAALKSAKIATNLWAIIDKKSLETSTCLVVKQVYDHETSGFTDGFKMARAPLEEAWITSVNLVEGHMEFREYVDEEKGVQDDGTYVWKGIPLSNNAQKENKKKVDAKREKVLDEARESGLID
jgi:hypothetical protein